jgi:hypothetical protein
VTAKLKQNREIQMITKITAALLATSLLVACGGTTTPAVAVSGQTPAQIAAAATKAAADAAATKAAADAAAIKAAADAAAAALTFNQLRKNHDDIEDLFTFTDFINPSTLPITPGAIAYEGFSVITAKDGNGTDIGGINGRASLALDLSKASGFSGSFGSFLDDDDKPLIGTLSITNGRINRSATAGTDTTLTGNVSGQLTSDEGDVFVLTGAVGADIVRTARDFIDGSVSGNIIVGANTGTFNGVFNARK